MQIVRLPYLWNPIPQRTWRDALGRYDDVIARQAVTTLAERDAWYRNELPNLFDELVAAQVPGLGTVTWTLGYYAKYAPARVDRRRTGS